MAKSRKQEQNRDGLDGRDWWKIFLAGFRLSITAPLTLMTGKLYYSNVWNAPVFAPYGVVVGVLVMAVSLI
ncbi:MAG TPA: hypothetical protein VEG63_03995 [Candidatus Acidoferrales bacterium]|nr:hypothetical protein [Candidatus Acidoferrales bacterium]